MENTKFDSSLQAAFQIETKVYDSPTVNNFFDAIIKYYKQRPDAWQNFISLSYKESDKSVSLNGKPIDFPSMMNSDPVGWAIGFYRGFKDDALAKKSFIEVCAKEGIKKIPLMSESAARKIPIDNKELISDETSTTLTAYEKIEGTILGDIMVNFDDVVKIVELVEKFNGKKIKIDYESFNTPASRREMFLKNRPIKDVVIVWMLYLSSGARVHKAAENSGKYKTAFLRAVHSCNIWKGKDENGQRNQKITIGGFCSATIEVGVVVLKKFLAAKVWPSYMAPGGKPLKFNYQFHPILYMNGGAQLFSNLKRTDPSLNEQSFLNSLENYNDAFVMAILELTGGRRTNPDQDRRAKARKNTEMALKSNWAEKVEVPGSEIFAAILG